MRDTETVEDTRGDWSYYVDFIAMEEEVMGKEAGCYYHDDGGEGGDETEAPIVYIPHPLVGWGVVVLGHFEAEKDEEGGQADDQ